MRSSPSAASYTAAMRVTAKASRAFPTTIGGLALRTVRHSVGAAGSGRARLTAAELGRSASIVRAGRLFLLRGQKTPIA